MNGLASSLAEIEALKEQAGGATCDIVVCPPFTLLDRAARQTVGSAVMIGAQDAHPQVSGAYTGDISAQMLADIGARFVILGHSERRLHHGEDDEIISAKTAGAHRAGLVSIVCVGETQTEREEGRATEVVETQLAGSLPDGVTSGNTVIAYEPVWAIGTGLVPTLEQIKEVHAVIRKLLVAMLGKAGADVRILYGGSVKGSNAGEIFDVPNVDGALVGGASLKAQDFLAIIRAGSADAAR